MSSTSPNNKYPRPSRVLSPANPRSPLQPSSFREQNQSQHLSSHNAKQQQIQPIFNQPHNVSNNSNNPSPNNSQETTHIITDSSTPPVLVYTIQTGRFRTEYPSILLQEPPRRPQNQPRRSEPSSSRSEEASDEYEYNEDLSHLSNPQTLLSPTIRRPGEDDDQWSSDPPAGESTTITRFLGTPQAIKGLISQQAPLSLASSPRSQSRKPSPAPKPKRPAKGAEPIITPIGEYNWYNPPLLPLSSSPIPPNFMIIRLPRWKRKFEFNWRTMTHLLTEEEKRQGTSIIHTRTQVLPLWVWIGRNFGIRLKGGIGAKWDEVWIERGG